MKGGTESYGTGTPTVWTICLHQDGYVYYEEFVPVLSGKVFAAEL